jgi:hypothetical protein
LSLPDDRKAELEFGYSRLASKFTCPNKPKVERVVHDGLPEKITDPHITDLELPMLFRVARQIALHGDNAAAFAAPIYGLPQAEIIGLRDHGRALGTARSKARSGIQRSRTLRSGSVPYGQTWSPNLRPSDIAPALPDQFRDRGEADRLFRLFISRAENLAWCGEKVNEQVLQVLERLLCGYSISVRGWTVHSRDELIWLSETLKDLKIAGERLRVVVNSLPKGYCGRQEEWFSALRKLRLLGKAEIRPAKESSLPMSREYQDFGVCVLRVLGLPEQTDLQLARTWGHQPVSSGIAAASIRVGCYYALIAIKARLGAAVE